MKKNSCEQIYGKKVSFWKISVEKIYSEQISGETHSLTHLFTNSGWGSYFVTKLNLWKNSIYDKTQFETKKLKRVF